MTINGAPVDIKSLPILLYPFAWRISAPRLLYESPCTNAATSLPVSADQLLRR